jgi:hypothetical protein
MRWDSSFSKVTGSRLDNWGLISSRGRTFSSTTTCIPAMGSTQPPIRRVLGSLLSGVKVDRHEANYLYFQSHILLHGLVLKHYTSTFTSCGAHPPSYPMRTRDSFPGVKQLEHEADHSPPSSAKVKECMDL